MEGKRIWKHGISKKILEISGNSSDVNYKLLNEVSWSNPSRIVKVTVKKSEVTEEEVLELISLIDSSEEIYEFTANFANDRFKDISEEQKYWQIFISFYSLNSPNPASKIINDKLGSLCSLRKLQLFSSYNSSDQILLYNTLSISVDYLRKVFEYFGSLYCFDQISMNKVLLRYNDFRSCSKVSFVNFAQSQKLVSSYEMMDRISRIFTSCLKVSRDNCFEVYFKKTNPFKLKQIGQSESKYCKENNPQTSDNSLTLNNHITKQKNICAQNQETDLNSLVLQPLSPNLSEHVPASVFSFSNSFHTNYGLNVHKISNPSLIKLDSLKFDGRTSLMLRNIPNSLNMDELLELINTHHKGLYDFIYLPVDFVNSSNLGYAFINCINTRVVGSIYESFENRAWKVKGSSKVCQVRYARIQGRSNLILHFRRGGSMKYINEGQVPLCTQTYPLVLPRAEIDSKIF